MNALQWAIQSTKEKGIVQTIKITCNVVMDLSFDWKYGTDTMRWVDRNALETQSDNRSHSAPYSDQGSSSPAASKPPSLAAKLQLRRHWLGQRACPADCFPVRLSQGGGNRVLRRAVHRGAQECGPVLPEGEAAFI